MAVGYQALKNSTAGQSNVAVGDSAMVVGTTGSHNVCIGSLSG